MSYTLDFMQTARAPAEPRTGGVLIAGGYAAPAPLLELASWTAAGSNVQVLLPGVYAAVGGPAALEQYRASTAAPFLQLQEEPAVDAARLIDAVHSAGADTLVVGYPADRPGRARVAQEALRARRETGVRLVLYFERGAGPWRRILVPYLQGASEAAAMELATQGTADVTLLHAVEPFDGPAPAATAAQPGRTRLRVVATKDPVTAAAHEARRGYDLVMIGGGDAPPYGRAFTIRQRRLLLTTDVSLAIVYPATR